ncbi:MAG TPA: MBL fold metallo-hydrolase [Nitrososphaerales archaeon]|nr:MBL fold metallo-hydrolase [Nitrososphaerales archaeon]
MWAYKNVNVHWLGHDSFVLQGTRTVIIDPFKAAGSYKADLLLISHEHFDHLSEDDIKRFTTPATTIIASKICESALKKFPNEKKFVTPGMKVEAKGVMVETVPAYNTNKFREPGKVFHPKQDGRVGFVVTLDNVTFYHAGDSDLIPEMKTIDVDVAFLPVSGTYVMTAAEAADAAKAMKVKVAVPMHYGSGVVGTVKDADEFKRLLAGNREVVILGKES